MKPPKQAGWIWLGFFIVACLALASCAKKKISAEEAKRSRLDWNLKTTVGAYEQAGYADAAWDEPARSALTEFARSRCGMVDPDENWLKIIGTNCDAAIKAGCDDPMIRYLYIRNYMSQTNSPKDFADAFCDNADALRQSSYPIIRKYYASLRALEQVYYANRRNDDKRPTGQLAQNLVDDLSETVMDKNTPPQEIYEACSQGLHQLTGSKDWYEKCYNKIEKPLFANWPKESISWLLKARANIELAWFARGHGWADSVTEDQWKLFREKLALAATSLDKAWKLNPNDPLIAREMMNVELGQGKGRDTMELWFQRAMVLDTNNYDACSSKLNYIQPKWHGSMDDMIEFGHECVQNEKWGGRVPLILLDAHRSINLMFTNETDRLNYWSDPSVWVDVKSAFDRFFELNPDSIGWYHNYAWYAYHARQWDTLNEIIPKLGRINYNFFGGRDEFDKMIQAAKEHTNKSAAASQK